jgi:hypothetical protein
MTNNSQIEERQAKLRELGIDEETDYHALIYAEEARCKREEIELQERERNEEHWRKNRLPYRLGWWWLSFGALNIVSESFTGHYLDFWLAGWISFVIAFWVVAILESANLRKNQ